MKKFGFITGFLFLVSFGFVSNSYRDYLPKHSSTQIIEHGFYTLSFDSIYNQANWVAYQISTETAFGNQMRSNNFREDPQIANSNAKPSYSSSGYDRGHLCPAGSMAFNKTAMSQSFYMSNMSPQVPGFNRGIWKRLETQVRIWGYEYDTIYVITGPVLIAFIDTIGEIPVPKYYYKVILDLKEPKAIGFVLENTSSSMPLTHVAVTIDSVETLTGIDFFSQVEDDLEQILESSIHTTLWNWDSKTPNIQKTESENHYQCNAITGAGIQCSRMVTDSNSYCWQHKPAPEPLVWVCGKSKVFHTAKDHRGLKRCRKEIYEMKLSEAIEMGKRECKDR